jgi:hypothetical protein
MEVTAAAERIHACADAAGLGGQVFFATLRVIEAAAGVVAEERAKPDPG